MADRYQNRSYARGPSRDTEASGAGRDESDPLAELARLIGQTDAFGTMAAPPAPSRSAPREARQHYQSDDIHPYQPESESTPPASPPAWMQRANIRREVPGARQPAAPRLVRDEPQAQSRDGSVRPVHPLHRHGAHPPQPQADTYYQDYEEDAAYQQPQHDADTEQELDASRYDDALYGQLESGAEDFQREPAYPDDPYAYQEGYEDGAEQLVRKRRPTFAVIGVLLLAIVGTGAAYAYRTYISAAQRGEPPIIKADNSPTKIIPAQADASSKVPDRMALGDSAEQIVPREEQPVDVNARAAGPRVVFPPLNQNVNPPSVASVAPTAMPAPQQQETGAPATPSNGTLPNSEPRKIRTFSVRGDQPDTASVPVNTAPAATPPVASKPAKSVPRTLSTQADASGNVPLSLAPQAGPSADSGTRIASTAPTQMAPSASSRGGGYLVQISSQKTEADAQASFRALQNKFPSVLSSQTPVIKRDDLGERGVWYQAAVGPFGTRDEAVQFCGNYKTAGGQCFVKKN
jgi:hypothetical protein